MKLKFSDKIAKGAFFHFEKRTQETNTTSSKRTVLKFTGYSTIVVSISLLTFIVTLLASC